VASGSKPCNYKGNDSAAKVATMIERDMIAERRNPGATTPISTSTKAQETVEASRITIAAGFSPNSSFAARFE
jgi:hypothetical protein